MTGYREQAPEEPEPEDKVPRGCVGCLPEYEELRRRRAREGHPAVGGDPLRCLCADKKKG